MSMGNTGLNFVLNFPYHPGFRVSGLRITEGPLYKGYQFDKSLF